MHVSAANAYQNLIRFVELNLDALLTELIHAFRLPDEHCLDLFALRVHVYEISEDYVDFITLFSHIMNGLFLRLFALYHLS